MLMYVCIYIYVTYIICVCTHVSLLNRSRVRVDLTEIGNRNQQDMIKSAALHPGPGGSERHTAPTYQWNQMERKKQNTAEAKWSID